MRRARNRGKGLGTKGDGHETREGATTTKGGGQEPEEGPGIKALIPVPLLGEGQEPKEKAKNQRRGL
jgi:hypothetical protein